jgi:hypothetical protein
MIINPTLEQKESFGVRRGCIERENVDAAGNESYTMIAIDNYITNELDNYFNNITEKGKFYLEYCDENDGRIIASKINR